MIRRRGGEEKRKEGVQNKLQCRKADRGNVMEEFKTEVSTQGFSISYCKRSKLLLQADKKQVQNGTVKNK